MPLDCNEVLDCLPPRPTGMALLGWDGEHLTWFAVTGPNQIIMSGPNNDLAFVNSDNLCALCAQNPPIGMAALADKLDRIIELLDKPKPKKK